MIATSMAFPSSPVRCQPLVARSVRGWFMCLSVGASCLVGGNGLLGEVAQICLHDVGVPAEGWVYYWDESAVRVLRVNVLGCRGECQRWAADSDRQRRCGSRLVGGLGV